MRKILTIALFGASLLTIVPAVALDDGKQFGCSATTGASVYPVTGGAPQCTFSVVCEPLGCGYVARVDANGLGLVAGRMEIRDVFDPFGAATTEWRGFSGAPNEPPSCSGTFTCSAPADGIALLAIDNPAPCCLIVIVTIACTSGGVAIVETISCSLTATQDQ